MKKILKIDKALYEVNDKTKTYRFFARNKNWKKLTKSENIQNKKSINGYTRIFRDKSMKKFKLK